MANPFQQQIRIRKVIYTGLILALLTTSWMFRKFLVERQAEDLQLREASRGEVELTSSAVRLTLTGSRGLAVTWLWYQALRDQDSQKWNEVELLVNSITKLQPYFITPWLFQSWNLAFNVAVENDKPRDKYYYVSRGVQLLAEGERRNQGAVDEKTGAPRFPGNPEMRHEIGFFYQLKLGTSDEKHAMQCLLDMSCIDPVKRSPETLNPTQGRDISLKEFETFCRNYPRLVRRLNDDLEYNTPKQIVDFLKDNYVLPARFLYDAPKLSGESRLEKNKNQFPVVPLKRLDTTYPDPDDAEFTKESIDPFVLSRTWYKYAQEPLPPPILDPEKQEVRFDPVKHRLPKMTTVIFRTYPARGQAYIAEALEEQGWFDKEGWLIREWFDAVKNSDQEVRVGTEGKYEAQPAWNAAYRGYFDVGRENSLYVTNEERLALEKEAQFFRTTHNAAPGAMYELRPDERVGRMEQSYIAHQKLAYMDRSRQMTNYDDHLYEAEAEKDPDAVLAHKLFFYGKQLNRSGESPKALSYFERAVPLWMDIMLRYPRFSMSTNVQEDSYELQLKYLRILQRERAGLLRPLVMGAAQIGACPYWPWDQICLTDKLSTMSSADKVRIIPIRNFRGPLDALVVWRGPHVTELRRTLLAWSQLSLPMPLLVYPGQQNLMLTSSGFQQPPSGTAWGYLIDPDSVRLVRDRVGLNRKPQ